MIIKILFIYLQKQEKHDEIKQSQRIKFKTKWHLNNAFLEAAHLATLVEKMNME